LKEYNGIMDIKKCDLCKKEIDGRKFVSIRFDVLEYAEFCLDCASPVLNFLKRSKIIDKNKQIIKKS
jgi:hypothetical protein